MLEKLENNDVVKIAKLSILGSNISDIISKYKSIIAKNANIAIADIGMITQTPLNSEIWIDILQSIENDRLYFNRCMGHIKTKNNIIPLGKPKKYSNKQLKEALTLRDKFTMKEISNMTGISKKTLERAMNKIENH